MLCHPAITESGFATLGASTSCPAAAQDPPAPAVMCPDLLHRFGEVSDGQSWIHPVAVVLTLCAAAAVAGMGSFTAIAGWATDVPAELESGANRAR